MSCLTGSLIILFVVGVPGLSGSIQAADPPKNEVPKPLPKELVQAWEKAGAKGRMDCGNGLQFLFSSHPE